VLWIASVGASLETGYVPPLSLLRHLPTNPLKYISNTFPTESPSASLYGTMASSSTFHIHVGPAGLPRTSGHTDESAAEAHAARRQTVRRTATETCPIAYHPYGRSIPANLDALTCVSHIGNTIGRLLDRFFLSISTGLEIFRGGKDKHQLPVHFSFVRHLDPASQLRLTFVPSGRSSFEVDSFPLRKMSGQLGSENSVTQSSIVKKRTVSAKPSSSKTSTLSNLIGSASRLTSYWYKVQKLRE
jgi:hypothetical protein